MAGRGSGPRGGQCRPAPSARRDEALWAMAPPEADESGVSEYLCTLQPHGGSQLAQAVLACRASCELAGLDVDSAWLYPPHVSVTGFFTATPEQAKLVCGLARIEMDYARQAIASEATTDGGHIKPIEVRRVLTTENGHVLLDVVAPAMSRLSAALAKRAVALGVNVRPKECRHMSLAAGREDPRQRRAIAELHETLPVEVYAGWELVVAKISKRSDVEALRREGRRHIFSDLLRVPIAETVRFEHPRSAILEWSPTICKLEGAKGEVFFSAGGMNSTLFDCSMCNAPMRGPLFDCSLGTGTPMKKRAWSWAGGGALGDKPTPPKLAKVVEDSRVCMQCQK